MNAFDDIYERGGWSGRGSGPGSQPEYVEEYVIFLKNFMLFNRIRSVVDFGCGDLNFHKYIDWSKIQYLGIDCVESVIERNIATWQAENVQFRCNDLNDFTYPPTDLLIVKDVLQHWPNKMIQRFLRMKHNARWIILVNDYSEENAHDIRLGECRPINLHRRPFLETGAYVFFFGRLPDNKAVFLLSPRRSTQDTQGGYRPWDPRRFFFFR